jgi:hypothetical protein
LLRHDGDPRHLIEAVRPAILALDHDLLIVDITTMSDHIGLALLPLRIASISSLIFGGLALLLSGLGIYGLISYFAGQRTREIGVRLALGAQTKDILKLVLSQGIAIVVIGIALGIAGAFCSHAASDQFLDRRQTHRCPDFRWRGSIAGCSCVAGLLDSRPSGYEGRSAGGVAV